MMIKNISDARKYVDKVKKGLIKNPFADKNCVHSLKIFAQAGDGEGFVIVIEFMVSGILSEKNLKFYQKEPLTFIEFLCMFEDSEEKQNYNMFQAGRGIKVKRLPTGRAQWFFQKIYGSHFFKEEIT